MNHKLKAKITYLQGYLEFPENLNTNLSEDLAYHFEFCEIERTAVKTNQFEKINIQKAQNCIYKWFIKEIDESYHEAFYNQRMGKLYLTIGRVYKSTECF